MLWSQTSTRRLIWQWALHYPLMARRQVVQDSLPLISSRFRKIFNRRTHNPITSNSRIHSESMPLWEGFSMVDAILLSLRSAFRHFARCVPSFVPHHRRVWGLWPYRNARLTNYCESTIARLSSPPYVFDLSHWYDPFGPPRVKLPKDTMSVSQLRV